MPVARLRSSRSRLSLTYFCSVIWVEEWKKTRRIFQVSAARAGREDHGEWQYREGDYCIADSRLPLSFSELTPTWRQGRRDPKILLHSLQAYDRPVDIRDSQYFLAPWFYPAGGEQGRGARVQHAGPGLFGNRGPGYQPCAVHTQIYDTTFSSSRRSPSIFFNVVPRSVHSRLLQPSDHHAGASSTRRIRPRCVWR